MGRWQAEGAWFYWLMALAACVLWLVCGPLSAEAAPASSPWPVPSPAASAASAGVPAPNYEERVRRCQAHPVRAVRDECLRQARKDFGR